MQQLPKCKCGQEVHAEEYMTPCYDDGGGLDSFDVELEVYDRCVECLRQSGTEYDSVVQRHDKWVEEHKHLFTSNDDLPF